MTLSATVDHLGLCRFRRTTGIVKNMSYVGISVVMSTSNHALMWAENAHTSASDPLR